MSTCLSYALPANISGAIKFGVPQCDFVAYSTDLLKPKSPILHVKP